MKLIRLTRLGPRNTEIMVNPDLIEIVETTPDTVVTLTTGNKFLVQETAAEICDRIIDFRAEVLRRAAVER